MRFFKSIFFTAVLMTVFGFVEISSAKLVGIETELDFPPIVFKGTTSYDAGTDLFEINASPIAIRLSPTSPPRIIKPTGNPSSEEVTIKAYIDDTGAFINGVSGDDLIVNARWI